MNKEALNYITKLLNLYPYSEFEIRQKLLRKNLTQEETQEIVSLLKKEDMINDARLARSILRKYSLVRGRGKSWLRSKMLSKGLDNNLISETLKERLEEDEMKTALKEGQKILNILPDNLDKLSRRRKLILRLKSRGFEGDIIFASLDKLL